MKKSFLLTILSVSCLNYAVQAMDDETTTTTMTVYAAQSQSPEKTDETFKGTTDVKQKQPMTPEEWVQQQLLLNPITHFMYQGYLQKYKNDNLSADDEVVLFSTDLVQHMVLESPEVLPTVMLTCKKWYLDTQDYWQGATHVYNAAIYKINLDFTEFKTYCPFPCKTDKGFCDYVKTFKVGFNQLIFKTEIPSEKENFLVPTAQFLCSFLKKGLDFPQNLKTDYSDTLSSSLDADKADKFYYLHAFHLHHTQTNINADCLSKVYDCFKQLNSFLTTEISEASYQMTYVNASGNSFCRFYQELEKAKKDNIHPKMLSLPDVMLPLYKLALVKADYHQKFFGERLVPEVYQKMLAIPVTMEGLDQDIEASQNSVEEHILDLAKLMWKTKTNIENYVDKTYYNIR